MEGSGEWQEAGIGGRQWQVVLSIAGLVVGVRAVGGVAGAGRWKAAGGDEDASGWASQWSQLHGVTTSAQVATAVA